MGCLTSEDFGRICRLASLALGAELVGSFGFFFAPGWANGWPGGLTIYQVWSTWLTLTVFMFLMTLGVGVGALVGLLCCIVPRGRRHAGTVFRAWIVIWAILSVVTCMWASRGIYASTLEMWPNGYPG
jgi:hypothetical protein